MIEVRVRFTDPDGTFWTSPIRNEQALASLKAVLDEREFPYEVFDDESTAAIADGCFQAADRGIRGSARGKTSWGPAARPHRFTCEIAKEPPGLVAYVHETVAEAGLADEFILPDVVGGWPLLDAEPPDGGWKKPVEQAVPPPRALAVFDPDTAAARPASWLDRLIAALLWFVAPIPEGSSR